MRRVRLTVTVDPLTMQSVADLSERTYVPVSRIVELAIKHWVAAQSRGHAPGLKVVRRGAAAEPRKAPAPRSTIPNYEGREDDIEGLLEQLDGQAYNAMLASDMIADWTKTEKADLMSGVVRAATRLCGGELDARRLGRVLGEIGAVGVETSEGKKWWRG